MEIIFVVWMILFFVLFIVNMGKGKRGYDHKKDGLVWGGKRYDTLEEMSEAMRADIEKGIKEQQDLLDQIMKEADERRKAEWEKEKHSATDK